MVSSVMKNHVQDQVYKCQQLLCRLFLKMCFVIEKIDRLDVQTITQIACGSHHTLALNEWGQIFSWGSNSNGQLGLNLQESVNLWPKMIKPLATKQVVQVACGRSHSLALTSSYLHFSIC